MSFKSWVDSKTKKCDLIDIKLIQLSSAAFVLMIAKLWKPLLSLDWYWYGVIFVLAMIKSFILEGVFRAALVMGVFFGFIAIVWGFLLGRLVFFRK